MPEVKLYNYMPAPMYSIEAGASVCYDSEPTADGRIMKACYASGHHSVLEHAVFTFRIKGVSRTMMAQITRHRVSSPSIRSQRYCREEDFGYVTPPSIKAKPDAMEAYREHMRRTAELYDELITIGISEEDARYILPNACETVIHITMNFRELIHICNERLCSKAQWEIREVVQMMRNEVVEVFPEAKRMLVPKCERFEAAFCTEKKGCGRHLNLNDFVKE